MLLFIQNGILFAGPPAHSSVPVMWLIVYVDCETYLLNRFSSNSRPPKKPFFTSLLSKALSSMLDVRPAQTSDMLHRQRSVPSRLEQFRLDPSL